MNRQQNSLGTQFVIGFIFTLLIPAIALAAVILYLRYDNLNIRVENSVRLMGELKTQEISKASEELEVALERLALAGSRGVAYRQLLTETEGTARQAALNDVEAALGEIEISQLSIRSMQLFSLDTYTIVASQGAVQAGQVTPALLVELETIRSTQIVSIEPDRYNEDRLLAQIVVPIFDETASRLLGHILISHDLKRADEDRLPSLYEALTEQPDLETLPDAYVALLSLDGNLLLASDNEEQPLFRSFADHAAIEAANMDGFDTGQMERYSSALLEGNVVGYYARVEGRPWVVVVEYAEVDTVAPMFLLTVPVIALGFLVILVINGFWNRRLYSTIIEPVQVLSRRLRDLPFGGQALDIVPLSSGDEVSRLHNSVIQTVQDLQKSVHTLRQENEDSAGGLRVLSGLAQLVQRLQEPAYVVEELARWLVSEMPEVASVYVYTYEEQTNQAMLRFATGDHGRQLLAQRYVVTASTDNLIGQTIVGQQSLVIDNIEESRRFVLPDMPSHPHAETLIPVWLRERVIGVLDVHGVAPACFSKNDQIIFKVLSLHLALPLAALAGFGEMQAGDQPQLSQLAWRDYYLRRRAATIGAVAGSGDVVTDKTWSQLQQSAITRRETVTDRRNGQVRFAVPVMLGDEVLGALEAAMASERFSRRTLQTAEELAQRLAQAVNNARLFEQSQRLVERERLVNEISQKLTTQTDVREILRTAVRELGQALGTPETQIILTVPKQTQS
ncbi:MAG: hypothetical protein GYB66_13080 [Chloroflexi bacterium]|nr:hypothetical protein [Chloroflexota bacterium]